MKSQFQDTKTDTPESIRCIKAIRWYIAEYYVKVCTEVLHHYAQLAKYKILAMLALFPNQCCSGQIANEIKNLKNENPYMMLQRSVKKFKHAN